MDEMIKWKAPLCYGFDIEKVSIVRESESSVWIDRNGKTRRHKKVTTYEAYVDTWDEAKAIVVKIKQGDVARTRERLEYREKQLELAEAIVKPE